MNRAAVYLDNGYEPVYLGEGVCGGLIYLSGASAEGGVVGVPYPVTALCTQVLFRNAAWARVGLCAGRSGIFARTSATPRISRCRIERRFMG